MRKWMAVAMAGWFFVVFDPSGKTVSKVSFKEQATCEYFAMYARIKADESCAFTGGTCPSPQPTLPNVVGCFFEPGSE